MIRGQSLAASTAVCLAFVQPARADRVYGTRSELLVEARHEIRATLHRGHAELRAVRTFHNGGKRHDQAVVHIELPGGAVATGLRTLGTLAGRPHWFAGELMEAEAAAEKYRELTGIGGYYPKDPALLSWRSQEHLALQVFPCAPAADKSVEYTLLVPTRYERGAHRLTLPALGTEELTAALSVHSANPRDAIRIDDRASAGGARIRPHWGSSVELAIVPKLNEPITGELAVVPFARRRVLTRFTVQAAPRISSPPKGAWIVIAIDASRSIEQAELDAQRAAAAAYLSHLPDARVEVLTFDRKTHRRYGRFVSAVRAARDLEAMPIQLANGSAVDIALADAERLLAAAPAGRPRRLLMLTDGLSRSRLRPERLASALGTSGGIAHLAIVGSDGVSVQRDDTHAWAAAPRVTGGLLWQAQARAGAADRDALIRAAEEWVRPLRLDRLRLYSPDIPFADRPEPPEQLDEGAGLDDLFIGERPVSWLRIEGELWSKPIQRVLHPDAAAAKRWSALVFGTDLVDELQEPEMMTLAVRGGAVSPVTSYLAIEPGVRPSTEGLDWGGGGAGFGVGVAGVRMAASAVSGRMAPFDREGFLKDALRPRWRACGGAPDTASVSFETTRAEVVDVTRVALASTKDPLLERCLAEAVWDLALTPHFSDDWMVWRIDV